MYVAGVKENGEYIKALKMLSNCRLLILIALLKMLFCCVPKFYITFAHLTDNFVQSILHLRQDTTVQLRVKGYV